MKKAYEARQKQFLLSAPIAGVESSLVSPRGATPGEAGYSGAWCIKHGISQAWLLSLPEA